MSTENTIISFLSWLVTPAQRTAPVQTHSRVTAQNPVSKSVLNRVHRASLASLAQHDYSTRKLERSGIAKGILAQGKDWADRVDWRQFALMLCPGIIRRTTLEGGREESCSSAALRHIELCLGDEGQFFSGNIPKPVLQKLHDSLHCFEKFLSYRLPLSDTPTSTALLEERAGAFLHKIQEIQSHLPEGQKTLYLPFGYRHGTANQGHAIPCKVVEKGDDVILTLFNLGNGANSHPILNYTINQKKMSYCFLPIRVPKKVFYGEVGMAAFCHLLRYLADAPPKHSSYDGEDIYDIFCQFFLCHGGSIVPDLGPHTEQYQADDQVSGNCSEVAVTNVTQDVLIEHNIPELERRKYFLNRDFCALIAGYHAYGKNPSCHPSACQLLHDATESFGSTILDFYAKKEITAQELVCAQAVVHEILKTLEKTPIPVQIKTSATLVNEFSGEFPLLPSLSRAQPLKNPSLRFAEMNEFTLEPPRFEEASIASFPVEMKKWIKTAATLPEDEAFRFVSDCIRALPIPLRKSEDSIDVWESIPPDAVNEILTDFEKLLHLGLRGVKIAKYDSYARSSLFSEQFMMIYTIYAIGDKLARVCEKETKLTGYASPFLPHPFQFDPNGFTSLPLKEDNDRFSKLEKYFSGKKTLSDEGPKEKVIFPIAPTLNVHQFVSDQLSWTYARERIQGRNHIDYLAKLLPPSDSRASEKALAAVYTSQWTQILPPQVRSLYYFSFLSNVLFSAPGKTFPTALAFSTTTLSGQSGLKIDNPFFLKEDKENESSSWSSQPKLELFTKDQQPDLMKPVKDLRFHENGTKAKSESGTYSTSLDSFIDFHSPEIRNLTTNDAVCYLLSEGMREKWKISEADVRTLLYMTRKDNLSLWQALQEFSSPDNHYLLNHSGVQMALDSSFFQPRFIVERLEQEPGPLVHAFRNFASQGLERYQNNAFQLSGILFLLRTGISFETYTPQDEAREQTLAIYRKTIDVLTTHPLSDNQRLELLLHRCFLESYSEQKDPGALFTHLFQAHLHCSRLDVNYPWLISSLPRFIRTSAYKYQNLLSDKKIRQEICQSIIGEALKGQEILKRLPSTGWEGEFPQFSCGDLTVDFFNGTIVHKKHGTLKKLGELRYMFPNNDVGEAIEREHGNLFWADKKRGFVSRNEALKYCPIREQWIAIKASSSAQLEESDLYSFQVSEIDQRGQGFLNWYKYLPWVHYKQDSGVIITYDQKKQCPVLSIEDKGGSLLYTRLDEEGRPLPYKLANLSKLRQTDHLYHYSVRYAYHDMILCFVHEKTQEVEELNFYRMNLQFAKDPKGLASAQFPGFYLIAKETDLTSPNKDAIQTYHRLRQEINEFEGAFTLYNPSTNKWIILFPKTGYTHNGDDFSKEVSSNSTRDVYEYEQYEFDSIEKLLKGVNHESKSYARLSVLFKMQRDYEKAYKYLNKIKSSSFFDDDTLSTLVNFTKIEDQSIPSVAFNLNLCLSIVKNKNLMIEKQFDKAVDYRCYSDFLFWGMENYKTYLKLLNESGYSRVPDSIRLKEGEKKMLLLAFKRFYQEHFKDDRIGWEAHWIKEQQILDNQFNVYFQRDRENTLKLSPQEIPLHPPAFSSVIPPSSLRFYDFKEMIQTYKKFRTNTLDVDLREHAELADYPVRTQDIAINAHFPELYEKARKCIPGMPDPFDFTLHALVKAKNWNNSESQLGQLLFWVRHFSDKFSDLEFSLEGADETNIDDFLPALNKIGEVVLSLQDEESERYKVFVESVLQRKIEYRTNKTVRLAIPREEYPHPKVQKRQVDKRPGDLHGYLTETHHQIHRLFNSPYKVKGTALVPTAVEEETLFLLKKDSEQILSFSKKAKASLDSSLPETIMKQVILKDDLAFFFKTRPMLSPEQMQTLCYLVNEWYHTLVLIKLHEEGKDDLYVPYDPQQYPEISYFYLKTGKFPRPQQHKTYEWICKGIAQKKNRHFQLPAGGGKTDVVIPLLNLGAKKWGLMPVSCVTQAIYPIDKENLTYNLGVLDESLCYLEVGMHMVKRLSAQDLEFIFSQLKQYKSEGKSLIITRHTYDAFFLLRDLSCKGSSVEESPEERGNKIRWGQNILNFFEDECLLICDESHQNADPLTRAIFGTGEFIPLPEHESDLLLKLMKPLLGTYPEERVLCKDGRDVAEVSHLNKINHHGNPPLEDIQAIQHALARHYYEKYFTNIPSKHRKQFLAYWTNQNAPQPELLKQWGRSKKVKDRQNASLVALTGDFLLALLPDAAKMRTQIDHARSLYPQKKFDVPCHNKLPTTAEYEAYKTTVLTIKGTYQRGILKDDLRQMLEDMIKTSSDEQRKGFRSFETPSNQRLQKWLSNSKLKSLCLENIVLSDEKIMRKIFEILSKNREVIEYFLTNYSFPGIGNPSEQLSCTSTNTFNGFRNSVSFSATPRDELVNPRCIKKEEDYRKDNTFCAEVKSKLFEMQNGQKIIVEGSANFFAWMKANQRESFEKATVLIDPRGFFSTYLNQELAEEWLNANPLLDGVLYCKEERSLNVDRNEKISLRLRDGKILELNGSDIKAACKEHGLDWEKLNLGTIYDPARTESANILQKPDATALFFLGDGLTTSHLIQAVMRLRGFLTLNQTIIWIVQRNLAQKISKAKLLTRPGILHWTDTNEKEQEDTRIILNAFQEIAFAIAEQSRRELKQQHALESRVKGSNMESVISTFQKHAQGLIERIPREAYEAFGEHEVLKKTREALLVYAQSTYAKFKYGIPYERNIGLQIVIAEIIADVEKRISHVYATANRSLASEMEQQQEIRTQKQRQQENQCPRPIEPLSLDGRYGDVKIYSPDYLHVERTQSCDVFKSPFLTKDLYLLDNHLRTARVDSSESNVQYLKPIHFFFIIAKKNTETGEIQVWADVNSNQIIASEQDDLITCPKKVEKLTHTVFLVSAKGDLIQKGRGAVAPTEESVIAITRSLWLQDLVIDAALMKGRIHNPDRLLERIKVSGWGEFETLWNKILKALPNIEHAQIQAYEKLKKRYLRTLLEDDSLRQCQIKDPDLLFEKIKSMGWELFEDIWVDNAKALPVIEPIQLLAYQELRARYLHHLREQAELESTYYTF